MVSMAKLVSEDGGSQPRRRTLCDTAPSYGLGRMVAGRTLISRYDTELVIGRLDRTFPGWYRHPSVDGFFQGGCFCRSRFLRWSSHGAALGPSGRGRRKPHRAWKVRPVGKRATVCRAFPSSPAGGGG